VTAVTALATFVDLDREAADSRQVSVSARYVALLADGRRLLLLGDRGWSVSGPDDIWVTTSVEDIVFTTRAVVGPDEPAPGRSYEQAEADHWAGLARVLAQQGVDAAAEELKRVPHEVVLSERLLARVGRNPT
jgi:hypothetical protein